MASTRGFGFKDINFGGLSPDQKADKKPIVDCGGQGCGIISVQIVRSARFFNSLESFNQKYREKTEALTSEDFVGAFPFLFEKVSEPLPSICIFLAFLKVMNCAERWEGKDSAGYGPGLT